jgi:integrase/recombinase XerD
MSTDNLRSHLESYLQLRQALGFKKSPLANALRDFIDYFVQHGQQGPVRAETTVDWARQASVRCYRSGPAHKLRFLRGFLIYLKAFDPETEIPSTRLVAEPRRPRAHLYTPEQIAQMMEAAQPWFWEAGSFRQKTYRTILGLLACTGLRVGEALRLTLPQAHLDDDPPYLEIRDTKFYKSRLVPLHSTTAAKLREYRSDRQQHVQLRRLARVPAVTTFFINDQGRPVLYDRVRKAMLQAQRHAGISKEEGPGDQGPALHALRHTFAVQRLLAWYRAGADVRAQLPRLSVYLGHLGMVETYRYLSATPELLTIVGEMFRRYAVVGGKDERR